MGDSIEALSRVNLCKENTIPLMKLHRLEGLTLGMET